MAETKKPQLTKIERMKQRQKKLASDIRKEENKLKNQDRKSDTRRKIIMGAIVIAHMKNDAEFRVVCERLQREGVKSDVDRALFNLEPLSKKENKT
jgi:hypothetical protein